MTIDDSQQHRKLQNSNFMPTTDASSTVRPAGIWAMPEASRQLAIKARDEIINPAHEQLEKIQSEFDEETAEVRQAIAAVQTKAVEIAENLEKTLAKAGNLLASNKMSVSAPTLAPLSSSPSPTSENVLGALRQKLSSRKHISEAERDLQSNREIVHSVLEKTKRPGNQIWPDSEGLGCLFGICILLAGGLGSGMFISLAGGRGDGAVGFGGFIVMALVVYVITMVVRYVVPRNTLKNGYEQVVENTQRARRHLESAIAESRNEAKKPLADAENTRRQALASLKSRLSPLVKKRHELFSEFTHASGFAGAKWNDARWNEWQMSVDPEFGARFGQVESITDRVSEEFPELSLPLTLPALLPFADGRGLLFLAPASHRELAAHAVQSLLARLLATIPAGKAFFTFFDPVGLGSNVAAFMQLAALEKALINSQAWTEPNHIEDRLAEITTQMERVIQMRLQNRYPTIHEYNLKSEVKEPFRFVVVFDFPANFTDTSVRRLVSIARNGARCGVYVIIVRDPAKPLPYGFEMSELEQLCEIIEPLGSANPGEETTSQTDVEVGAIYQGTVVSIKEFGAFVEVLPGKDGLVHISELADTRVNRVEDVVNIGDSVWVKCIGVDDKGRVKLSRKATIKNYDEETDSDDEKYAPPATLARNGNQHGNKYFQWRTDAFQGTWRLIPDAAPPIDLLSAIIKQVGEQAKAGMRVEVPFKDLCESEMGWTNNASTRNGIEISLGPSNECTRQRLRLGVGLENHALIIGRPGSGKSNLMHVIITGMALKYPPSELELYLVDFKGGVEFKPYAVHRLPHARAVAIFESEREFGMSILRRLGTQMGERENIFRKAGVNDLPSYREQGNSMTRIVLLVDEFQDFFVGDDSLAGEAREIFDRLIRKGRSAGIHIILGSQNISGRNCLHSTTINLITIRIALQCSDMDSRMILAQDNSAARLLSRPGEAIYNDQGGVLEGNNDFQVARYTDEDQKEFLPRITNWAQSATDAEADFIAQSELTIFEGDELPLIEDCKPLMQLLHSQTPPESSPPIPQLWLGDAIEIRPPISLLMERQRGSNLLIVTREEEEGAGLCIASQLSLLAQQRAGEAVIYNFDLTTANAAWAEHAEEIRDRYGKDHVQVLGRRDPGSVLSDIASEVERRSASENAEGMIPILVVFQGLHRIRDLRSEGGFFSEPEQGSPSSLLVKILKNGPEVGVHTIAWVDSLANAKRCLDDRAMREFYYRIVGPLSREDSQDLLDAPNASWITKPHRLLLFEEDRPGVLTLFRPYALPDLDGLRGILASRNSP